MRRGAAALIVGLVLGHERLARAEDEELAALLEESVVAGPSQTAERAHDAPATTSTISGDYMRRYGIRSLAEAIDFLSLGLVTQDALHMSEVGSRGVLVTGDYNDHLLVLIDGHVVNEAFGSSASIEQGLGLPLELIDRVEIMLGPGSVLYGGNAMLAVVNVITRRTATYGGVRVIAEGTLSPGQTRGRLDSLAPRDLGASYRVGVGAGHEVTLLGKKLEITAQVERYGANAPVFVYDEVRVASTDGTRKDYGPAAPALGVWGGAVRNARQMDTTTGYARIVAGELAITLRGTAFDRDTPFPHFNQVFGNFDDPASGEHELHLALGVTYARQLTPKLRFDLQGTGRSYDYRQRIESVDGNDCVAATAGACRYYYRSDARWGVATAMFTYDWRGDDRLTSVVGIVGQVRSTGTSQDSVEAATNATVLTSGARRDTELPYGAFVQQRWSPLRAVHLNGGLRFDDMPRGGRHLSPRAAVAVDPWRGGTVKAIWSQAFRPPTLYEQNAEAPGILRSAELVPEREKSFEVTLEERFGRHRLLFGGFRTWWRDMIGYVCSAASGACRYANTGSIDSWGFQGRAEGSFGPLQYGLSVTGARARETSPEGTAPLPAAPQLYGNARLAYDLGAGRPTLALAGQLVGARLADRALDGGWASTPVAPVEVRAKLTLSGPVPYVAGLAYRVGVDVATASRSAYVAGPYGTWESPDGSPVGAALAPVNRLTVLTGLQYAF